MFSLGSQIGGDFFGVFWPSHEGVRLVGIIFADGFTSIGIVVKGALGQVFRGRLFPSRIVVFPHIAHDFLDGQRLPVRQFKPVAVDALVLAPAFFDRIAEVASCGLLVEPVL